MSGRRIIAGNLLSLTVLQAVNYSLPLIMLPFLTRSLGISAYGTYALAMYWAGLARTVVAYGFDMTATRDVAACRDRPIEVGRLVCGIVSVRVTLAALVLGLALIMDQWAMATSFRWITTSAVAISFGEALAPYWLFQGMEQMYVVTAFRVAARVAWAAVILLTVRCADDVIWVALSEALISLVVGLAGLWFAVSKYSLAWVRPRAEEIISHVKSGGGVLVSNLSVHGYTTANVVILGCLWGSPSVAHYAIADRIYSGVRGMLGPVVQSVYPALARVYSADTGKYRRVARTMLLWMSLALCVLAVATAAFSSGIVELIVGRSEPDATSALLAMSGALALAHGGLMSSLLIIQNMTASLMRITLAATLVNAATIFPLCWWWGAAGTAASFAVSQAAQCFMQVRANSLVFSRSEPSAKTLIS